MDYPETKDQKLYRVDGRLKAEIDVCITNEQQPAPSIARCRHAVLPLSTGGYVVYDRLLCRIVNGVYFHLDDALDSAQHYNEDGGAPQNMTPNGVALGLLYPDGGNQPDEVKRLGALIRKS